MNITVDISMYPLNAGYEAPILAFIDRLHKHGLTVKTNATSTHITGEFHAVFKALEQEIKYAFEHDGKMVLVTKIINSELDI